MPDTIERLIQITSELVKYPSVSNNVDALFGCLSWARQYVQRAVPDVHIHEFNSAGKPSVMFSVGSDMPSLLMCGHLDVVEASTTESYQVVQSDGYLMGRGTADMKGPVAALLDVFETEHLPGLGMLLTTDEEVGGTDGTRYVLQNIDWRPKVVVLPDGGANMHLVIEQKGVIRLRVKAVGLPAHSSRPWLGDSAIERLIRAYQGLLRKYPRPSREDDWRISVAMTELHGGEAENAIPESAWAIFDIRYPGANNNVDQTQVTTGETGELVIREVHRLLTRYHVTVELLVHAANFSLDVRRTEVEHFQAVAKATIGHTLPVCREAGASDARYFALDGIPVLVFQPDCADWHSNGERISLQSLHEFDELCRSYVRAQLT